MTRTIFDDEIIASWDAALDDRPPEITEIEVASVPQIEAFASVALTVGMAIRFRARDRGEYAFVINPVAARHLAVSILHHGQQAGWLDEAGNVIKPRMPPLDG